MKHTTNLVRQLLLAPPTVEEWPSVAAWWSAHREVGADWPQPMARAVLAGFFADRLAWAFAGGYQAAGRAMLPGLPPDRLFSLCVTESGGGHPRAIQASLTATADGFVLNGEKRWATLSGESELFFVAASSGSDDAGRKRFRLARVGPSSPGVTIKPMPPTPFVPEISHCTLRFEDVAVGQSDLLPGDGYERYIKPFRTIEDLHVNAALLGYLIGAGRRYDWPQADILALVHFVGSLVQLAEGDPLDPVLHLRLAGHLEAQLSLVDRLESNWQTADESERRRWNRDKSLLSVAEMVRQKRTERALERIRSAAIAK